MFTQKPKELYFCREKHNDHRNDTYLCRRDLGKDVGVEIAEDAERV